MTWQGIQGHDAKMAMFRHSLERGRLPSAFLFVGPPGVGKRLFARKLAQTLLCETRPEAEMNPCGECPGCRQALANTHPDLEIVSKPKDRSFIPLDLLIGDAEHRARAGLCHSISLTPYRGGRKVAIIEDADLLTEEGANCLLKTLEEPPPKSMIILIGTSVQRQLPTIRSRCQTVRFAPLAEETLVELLMSQGVVERKEEAQELASLAGGSLDRAIELSDAELRKFRGELLTSLAEPGFDTAAFGKDLAAAIEAAGKDAPSKRERMRQIFGFAAEFYRQLLRSLSGDKPRGDTLLLAAARTAVSRWPSGSEGAAACLDRCLEALGEVDANANQASLLDCWLDDLSTTSRDGRPAAPYNAFRFR